MSLERIVQILAKAEDNKPVTVHGWVRTKRVSKNLAFLMVNDGSCQANLQAIIDEGTPAHDLLAEISTGCAVRLEGTLKKSPAKGQSWELVAKTMEILGRCDNDYPLQKKGHSLEFLREIGHLRPRTNTFGAVFRVRNLLAAAIHEFFQERGFVWAQTPIITASDCEGAGEMFQVTTLDLDQKKPNQPAAINYEDDFFGTKAHLTVSGQLEAEFLALGLGSVYTFGPTFRAENSNTARHLAEFWMVEPEVAFASLTDIMDLAEEFLQFLVRRALDRCPDDIAFFEKMYKTTSVAALTNVAESTFARISYTEAVELLLKSKESFEFPVSWGIDLATEHERYLSEKVFGKPVMVHDYPSDFKAFYMRANDDGKTVAALDVLVPGVGELIGGSQREERLDYLTARMKQFEVPTDHLSWYTDLRRFGSVPHSGFGLGFERLVMYVTGMQNIRDVIMCPRSPKNIAF